jgi:hypothetical protein
MDVTKILSLIYSAQVMSLGLISKVATFVTFFETKSDVLLPLNFPPQNYHKLSGIFRPGIKPKQPMVSDIPFSARNQAKAAHTVQLAGLVSDIPFSARNQARAARLFRI